jgi:hypothetical protein
MMSILEELQLEQVLVLLLVAEVELPNLALAQVVLM